MKSILIYGAGGFAREVAWLIETCNELADRYTIVGFIDDNEKKWGKDLNGIKVIGLDQAHDLFPAAFIVSGVGSPQVREKTMTKAFGKGFKPESIIHPRVEMSKWIEVGAGSVICAGNILTTNIILGEQVQINLDCTIGHDAVLEDFATLAPGVHISGNVHLKKSAYVGTGAVIINGSEDEPLIIGEGAVVGAGACVTKSVDAGQTVVGIPAKPLKITG
jgi:sugar O-acyltransferase (sialic acid O-acetyltransferase NeuD family)